MAAALAVAAAFSFEYTILLRLSFKYLFLRQTPRALGFSRTFLKTVRLPFDLYVKMQLSGLS